VGTTAGTAVDRTEPSVVAGWVAADGVTAPVVSVVSVVVVGRDDFSPAEQAATSGSRTAAVRVLNRAVERGMGSS
jgi:hypothetical protein